MWSVYVRARVEVTHLRENAFLGVVGGGVGLHGEGGALTAVCGRCVRMCVCVCVCVCMCVCLCVYGNMYFCVC